MAIYNIYIAHDAAKSWGRGEGFGVETKAQATQSMTAGLALTHKLDLTLSPSTVVLVFCESVSVPSKYH